jgi:hexokinase
MTSELSIFFLNLSVLEYVIPNQVMLCSHEQLQPMIPTYVFGWPTGDEKGEYLAVDLGKPGLP